MKQPQTDDHTYYMPPDKMQLPRQPDVQDLGTGAVHLKVLYHV